MCFENDETTIENCTKTQPLSSNILCIFLLTKL